MNGLLRIKVRDGFLWGRIGRVHRELDGLVYKVQFIDRGSGPPLVLIPGIQGKWEYLRPAVEALSQSFRVLTFPLCGEPGSGVIFEPARGLDNYVAQTLAVLDQIGVARAIVCGISFGGLIALRFAATHAERTSARARSRSR